ncbi:MAG: cell division ATP-binding protein FtsE [Chloroflexota bacterium]
MSDASDRRATRGPAQPRLPDLVSRTTILEPPTTGPAAPWVPDASQVTSALVRVDAAPRLAISLTEVTKVYPNGKHAIEDIDLEVPEGDFVFLVGPSGAGKSTLIKLLVRDEVPTSGSIVVAGVPLATIRRGDVPRLRRRIGIVFQDFRLLPRKTVRENVAFALEVTGTPRRSIRPTVDRLLALVGLSAQADQRPGQLSGGEMQRAAIARAMVHDPELVIADEPTGNLDPLISWEIIQLLLRINEMGTTVLMATHNAEVVTALRKRVVGLEGGRIIRDEVGGYHREYA